MQLRRHPSINHADKVQKNTLCNIIRAARLVRAQRGLPADKIMMAVFETATELIPARFNSIAELKTLRPQQEESSHNHLSLNKVEPPLILMGVILMGVSTSA